MLILYVIYKYSYIHISFVCVSVQRETDRQKQNDIKGERKGGEREKLTKDSRRYLSM